MIDKYINNEQNIFNVIIFYFKKSNKINIYNNDINTSIYINSLNT